MYSEHSNDFHVTVEPVYMEDQSSEENNYFFFAYTVKVSNLGKKSAQLLSRHWHILDGDRKKREEELEKASRSRLCQETLVSNWFQIGFTLLLLWFRLLGAESPT